MITNDYAVTLIENIHTLEDSEITALFTALMVEMDRRFIDIDDAFEEGQEVIEHQYDDEEETTEDAFDHSDREGW